MVTAEAYSSLLGESDSDNTGYSGANLLIFEDDFLSGALSYLSKM